MLDYTYFYSKKFLRIPCSWKQQSSDTAYLNASQQLLLVMKILKPRFQLPFTMSRNIKQDMKLYFEKSLVWFLYAKKLNNKSRPHQPYTQAPVGSKVTQKKLTFHGTSSLETLFTTTQHRRTLSRAQ
jgi:hypothetical protein